ncbi:glycosyl transferase [Geminocystis sp. NIES-3708]|uniref:glycosyltransferase family 2 protein n=1 Tax=Geminocystis sp. NIES-3708 TaxID=1615909 RepID=UPI0005FCA058|nr:glycosyltransferase family A protein [Geminocystis sp. NIES-3708]BAQ61482.1 glycosyl transferase [Geminocystis sp. NIES-3708]
MTYLAVIIIGRNEGVRLVNCLLSLKKELPQNAPIIYIDSGSTDDSVKKAQELGVITINLDLSIPFTAARARNMGLEYIINHYPDTQYIQFLDGDCELLPNWLQLAIAKLEKNEKLAIVCGRRKEKFPDKSLYNRLIDMEWNTSIGEAKACGGDALMRLEALKQVNGYNPSLICGEEPEMCIRLREKGWKIERLDLDMTLHDAAMFKFSQWWKRSIRGGWAVAEGYFMHGKPPENYMKKEYFSGYLWGLIIPFFAFSLILITKGFSLFLLFGYFFLMIKIYRYRLNFGDSKKDAKLYSFWCVLSKFPQFIGQYQYLLKKITKQKASIIEYKN